MADKYASASFQMFAKNEIGYKASSPKCRDCVHCEMKEGMIDREWVHVCDVLNKVGLIVVDPDGCCNLYEFRRAHCVPKETPDAK